MVVPPAAAVVASPALETKSATPVAELSQLVLLVTSEVEPSELLAVAVN